ncbi:nucleotide-binding universal stress UspA family protein [Halohasta litchfieldiae]|jgi:nucleotide-binding universal stress UspA family protein|uniref:Nucleotide-binding universal stress protein, UspA family n=1 Tax=Halohasta litchfieldiae TaxID=1073996 RepID=A0A1H6TX75_9EURY|nr:universal stress protein [Halohasta litchfieldiae]ATW87147.1 nucleotide-binding universal stress UspA family protein [Halohasta litchfieldiae]SEI84643.1 Nucleotide-binding universal stress protein, UspA family [Halohasta litchfieldiae]
MTSDELLSRPVVPISGPEDAEATYNALVAHTDPADCRPLVLHVIVDTEGSDSINAQYQHANDACEQFKSRAAADGMIVGTEIRYGKPVSETIIDVAEEYNGSSIVFCSRDDGAWFDLLLGGVRTALITKSKRPVVMLPVDEDY